MPISEPGGYLMILVVPARFCRRDQPQKTAAEVRPVMAKRFRGKGVQVPAPEADNIRVLGSREQSTSYSTLLICQHCSRIRSLGRTYLFSSPPLVSIVTHSAYRVTSHLPTIEYSYDQFRPEAQPTAG